MAAGWGADVVGVNPLHAMFFDDPEQASPYSPASRLFLNILNIDPSRIPGFAACAEAREICASADHQRELAALRARRHVGYRRAARVKDRLLWALFRAFRDANGDPGAHEAFARFRRSQGETLRALLPVPGPARYARGRDGGVDRLAAMGAGAARPGLGRGPGFRRGAS